MLAAVAVVTSIVSVAALAQAEVEMPALAASAPSGIAAGVESSRAEPNTLPTTPRITNKQGDDTGATPAAAERRLKPLPPLQPNDFQRFVLQATGKVLPVYGQQYFEQGDRGFAPLERVPVPADYVLGPGDELYIRAWGSIDVDYRATIDRNGQINLPRVGTLGVAGLKASEVESHINSQIGRVYKNYSLNVTLGQLRSIQVFVVGQARGPGSYTVSSLSTLVNVVFGSGGPGPNGSLRRIQLKRGDKLVTELDLYEFMIQGSKAQDVRLLPGDVIVYQPAGPRVALLGAVDTPAVYELKPSGESIDRLLAYSGGTRASTNQTSAQLERINSEQPRSPRSVTTVDLAQAAQLQLRDGDLLTLFAVAPQFANAVTLRGNVAAPLRYPYTAGMHISQLIPDRDALITPDYYVRKNKLVQYTQERRVTGDDLTTNVKNIVDEPNWEYAAIERLNPGSLTMEVIPFNLGKAVLERDPAHDIELKPGDVVTIFGQKDIRSPLAKQSRLVRVEGEVGAPGIYPVALDDTLPKLLAKAGGLTPQAYTFGIEFSREETRRTQQIALDDAIRRLENDLASAGATRAANLSATNERSAEQLIISQQAASRAQLTRLKALKANGRISLELEPSLGNTALPDLQLEDGDRIVVPHRPAYVFAVGAVANNNALLWRKGRKLTDYLDTAGVAIDADLDNMFVLRADGSVSHASRRGWFNNLEKLELLPGDTVVVPGKTDRETAWTAFVRGLKDWSQILSQFGLTAAAIRTLSN